MAILTLLLAMTPVCHSDASELPTPANPSPETLQEGKRTTRFEWDPIDKAKSYEIEIQPLGLKKETQAPPLLYNVTEPLWSGSLAPGRYTMRLRARDQRGVPGEWSSPEGFIVKLYAPSPVTPLRHTIIKTKENETYELHLKWATQSEASKFRLKVEDDQKEILRDFETEKNSYKIALPVARNYTWTLIGYDHEGKEGEPLDAPIPFILLGKKLETPKIQTPESPFVRKLEWQSVPYATQYKYSILRKGGDRKWRRVKDGETEKKVIEFSPKWKGGEYKMTVFATGELREPSKKHTVLFTVAEGDRSPLAEQKAQLRKGIDRTSDWYFVASYLITQINYSSSNVDEGSASSINVIGGTGRLGAGYFDTRSPFGFLGIADLSGFTIGNKNYTYPSLEAHGIYRHLTGDRGEIRASGGLYYKDIPEILGNAETGDFKVDQIGLLGLHTGGEYWYSLNAKLGLQANARIYMPLSGQTPNGKELLSTPSYQFGFMGSLRLNKRATGLMGYAYRMDQAHYKASNSTALAMGHEKNQTSIVGHYLNFFLELDF